MTTPAAATRPTWRGLGHQLQVAVDWTNPAADFEVYLLDAAGREVVSAASSAKPEQMVVPPTAGRYTVRVVPFLPLGDSIRGTAPITATPADPAPSTAPRPGFATSVPPASLSKDVHNAGKPSIGADHRTGAVLYQA